jgi:hypothetical protein
MLYSISYCCFVGREIGLGHFHWKIDCCKESVVILFKKYTFYLRSSQ